MKVERITSDTMAGHSPQQNERLERSEKGTLTEDAVTFDGERREPGANPKFKKSPFLVEEDEEQTVLPDKKDGEASERKIDILA